MTLQQATNILCKEFAEVGPDGLHDGGKYISWSKGETTVTLDDKFTVDELEAIVVFIRNAEAS